MPNAADARRLDLDHTGAALIMRPEVPDLLQDVLAVAELTLKRASGDDRRIRTIDDLLDRVGIAKDWATDEPRRFVNDWTRKLLVELRTLEQLGPLGDRVNSPRATELALSLIKFVREDALAAMLVRARAGREAVR